MRKKTSVLALSLFWSALIASGAFAETTAGGHDSGVASKPNPLNNLYFGEQHLHTSASVDAFVMGNRKNSIEDAFNYNKGKPVKKWLTGETLQRKRPYDWTAVTDHSEYLNIMEAVSDPKSPLQKDPIVIALKTNDPKKMDWAFKTLAGAFIGGIQYEPFNNMKILRPAWDRHKAAINKHNEPGKFTTLIAYEWTSMPGGENLHRNVFFRDDKGPEYPFTSMDSPTRGLVDLARKPACTRSREFFDLAQREHQQQQDVRAHRFGRRSTDQALCRAARPE